jgi:hypothetical protein
VKSVRNFRTERPQHSLCEKANAGSASVWHIRRLTHAGRMLGGKADTRALCGKKVSWDLSVEIKAFYLNHCCAQCALIFATENNDIDLKANSPGARRLIARPAPSP